MLNSHVYPVKDFNQLGSLARIQSLVVRHSKIPHMRGKTRENLGFILVS